MMGYEREVLNQRSRRKAAALQSTLLLPFAWRLIEKLDLRTRGCRFFGNA